MRTFKIDGETWILSQCGYFVRPLYSGWYNLEMFSASFKEAASKAK